ncbi:hypothetical protein WA026_015566 [Henosepilachna vigintioctopunctata]|uniref:Uncharacterized protein n=1 Tax=Henosepilachna vigintioctopunctata TaxID=420089 RepID=A0AAW1VGZ3_9CUCU
MTIGAAGSLKKSARSKTSPRFSNFTESRFRNERARPRDEVGKKGVSGVYLSWLGKGGGYDPRALVVTAAQKLNLTSSPHRRKRYNSEDGDATGFCGVLQRNPPPVPPALLRRLGMKEVTGVGKVRSYT